MTISAQVRRFFEQVTYEPSGGCWLWTGTVNGKYYGAFLGASAHRFSYRWFKRAIPAGYHVDHLCKVRECVNPRHLEAVTPRENFLRSHSWFTTGRCRRGHLITPENVVFHRNRTTGANDRACRECRQLRQARWLRRQGRCPAFAAAAFEREAQRRADLLRRAS